MAILYLLECLHWLRLGQVAFVSEFARFRMHSSSGWHSRLGRPCWGPLLPFGRRIISQAWPLAISPRGILSGVPFHEGGARPEVSAGQTLAFDRIDSIRCDGNVLYVNGIVFARCGHPRQAHAFATRLKRLRTLDYDARADEIGAWLRERLDLGRTRDQWNVARRATFDLRIASTLLFLYLLVGLPWFLATRPLVTTWPSLLAAWVVLWALHAALYVMAHRAIHKSRMGAVVAPLLTHVLVPMMAVRAHVGLTQGALWESDPIAVSRCLGDHRSADQMIRWVVHGSVEPTGTAAERMSLRSDIGSWFQREFVRALESMHAGDAKQLASALGPPPREGSHSLSYCPRCQAQYVVAAGTCGSCQHVRLVPFAGQATPLGNPFDSHGPA